MLSSIAGWLLNILLQFLYKKTKEEVEAALAEKQANDRDKAIAAQAVADLRKPLETPVTAGPAAIDKEGEAKFDTFFNDVNHS